MQDYDLALDADGDISYTADPDIAVVDGAALVAQDVRRTLEFPRGAFPWSPNTGSDIAQAVNDHEVSPAAVETELLRAAQNDARIDQTSVRVVRDADGKATLHFVVLAAYSGGTNTAKEVRIA